MVAVAGLAAIPVLARVKLRLEAIALTRNSSVAPADASG